MLPIINLLTYLDLGGKSIDKTGISFYIILLEFVAIMAQSQTKYDQFLTQYPAWLFPPIYTTI